MIETERLRLRNWREGDAAPFHRHTNTPAVMRWLGGAKTRERIDEVVSRLTSWQEERGFTFWAVERKQDCELLGFCGLSIVCDPGSPVEGEYEVGWRLREDCWGRGYAREAAIASIDSAFDSFGASRLVALTVQGNTGSWGLMKRLGMIRRPELDYIGPAWAEGTVIVYSVEKDAWRARG